MIGGWRWDKNCLCRKEGFESERRSRRRFALHPFDSFLSPNSLSSSLFGNQHISIFVSCFITIISNIIINNGNPCPFLPPARPPAQPEVHVCLRRTRGACWHHLPGHFTLARTTDVLIGMILCLSLLLTTAFFGWFALWRDPRLRFLYADGVRVRPRRTRTPAPGFRPGDVGKCFMLSPKRPS